MSLAILILRLLVGLRHGAEVPDRSVAPRPSVVLLLAVERGPSSIAVDVDFEDGRVMDEAVDRGQCHGRVRENLAPGAEGLIYVSEIPTGDQKP